MWLGAVIEMTAGEVDEKDAPARLRLRRNAAPPRPRPSAHSRWPSADRAGRWRALAPAAEAGGPGWRCRAGRRRSGWAPDRRSGHVPAARRRTAGRGSSARRAAGRPCCGECAKGSMPFRDMALPSRHDLWGRGGPSPSRDGRLDGQP